MRLSYRDRDDGTQEKGGADMDARGLFLMQHAAMHSAAVSNLTSMPGRPFWSIADRTFGGLSNEQMRIRPREDLNSLAWILWHIARAEDIFVNAILAGRDQVFDGAWTRRLNVTRRDLGFAMTTDEVTELTRAIDVDALREYRDAVGRRTRQLVGEFGDKDWAGDIAAPELERAAGQGAFGPRADYVVKVFSDRPRAAVLSYIGVFHPSGHMGEAVTVRGAGGFGTGT
jgi:hypothetical protein